MYRVDQPEHAAHPDARACAACGARAPTPTSSSSTRRTAAARADALNAGINFVRYPLFCCSTRTRAASPISLQSHTPLPRVIRPHGCGRRHHPHCQWLRRLNGGWWARSGAPASSPGAAAGRRIHARVLCGRLGWNPVNGLLVISGAFGVFHKETVIEAGGYRADAIGEDIALLRPPPRAHSPAPAPVSHCLRAGPGALDRGTEHHGPAPRPADRWQRGLSQTLWLHRRMMFSPRYGAVGMAGPAFFLLFECLGAFAEAAGYIAIRSALRSASIDAGRGRPVLHCSRSARASPVTVGAAARRHAPIKFRRRARLRPAPHLLRDRELRLPPAHDLLPGARGSSPTCAATTAGATSTARASPPTRSSPTSGCAKACAKRPLAGRWREPVCSPRERSRRRPPRGARGCPRTRGRGAGAPQHEPETTARAASSVGNQAFGQVLSRMKLRRGDPSVGRRAPRHRSGDRRRARRRQPAPLHARATSGTSSGTPSRTSACTRTRTPRRWPAPSRARLRDRHGHLLRLRRVPARDHRRTRADRPRGRPHQPAARRAARGAADGLEPGRATRGRGGWRARELVG